MAQKCKTCGKMFVPKVDAVYCSLNCYHRDYYHPRSIKQCAFCGNDFNGTVNENCCSKVCYKKQYLIKNADKIRKQANISYHNRNPPKEYCKVCEFCKKEFTAPFGQSNKKYCGEKCRVGAYRSTDKGKTTRIFDYHKRRHDMKVHTFSPKEWEFCKSYFNNACVYCGAKGKLHQDHFIPLKLGGKYVVDNIVPACPSCNFSKNKKNPKDFATKAAYENIMKYFSKLKICLTPLALDGGDSPRLPGFSTPEGFTPAEQGSTPAPRQ